MRDCRDVFSRWCLPIIHQNSHFRTEPHSVKVRDIVLTLDPGLLSSGKRLVTNSETLSGHLKVSNPGNLPEGAGTCDLLVYPIAEMPAIEAQ